MDGIYKSISWLVCLLIADRSEQWNFRKNPPMLSQPEKEV